MTVVKPEHVFDREREWQALTSFAGHDHRGATLGVVSGRRRQGKSFLLQALTEAIGGLYFGATEATEAESLRLFTEALVRYTRRPVDIPFRDWNDAIRVLFREVHDKPVPIAIDEFPFLSRTTPSLPSIIQRELGPGGSGADSTARLLLCGSAMSVMGRLLAGQAPLRGRAGLEMVVRPFRFRDAAAFWGIADPHLAMLVHAVVGGTPAYRREFVRGDAPAGRRDFDAWVVRTVLNPETPLFREARYLLAEEPDVRDPALYHSVLAAIATGHTTNGAIANFIGRKADQIAHPLNVLEDAALIVREPDMFRPGRATYRVVEPLITFYEAIMRRRWPELEIGRAQTVWEAAKPSFLSQVAGPHFEALCREFALEADADVYGGLPAEVGSGVVNDSANRSQIQVDVVVFGVPEHGGPRRILSLGEAKWTEVMGRGHVERLSRARDLLAVKGFEVRGARLACYSASGFTDDLRGVATQGPVLLIDPERIYHQR